MVLPTPCAGHATFAEFGTIGKHMAMNATKHAEEIRLAFLTVPRVWVGVIIWVRVGTRVGTPHLSIRLFRTITCEMPLLAT